MYFLWVGENFLQVLEYWSPILLENMKPINRGCELCLAHNLSICWTSLTTSPLWVRVEDKWEWLMSFSGIASIPWICIPPVSDTGPSMASLNSPDQPDSIRSLCAPWHEGETVSLHGVDSEVESFSRSSRVFPADSFFPAFLSTRKESDSGGPALITSLDVLYSLWIATVPENFPCLSRTEGAYILFLQSIFGMFCSWQPSCGRHLLFVEGPRKIYSTWKIKLIIRINVLSSTSHSWTTLQITPTIIWSIDESKTVQTFFLQSPFDSWFKRSNGLQ